MDNECHANICAFVQNIPDPPPPYFPEAEVKLQINISLLNLYVKVTLCNTHKLFPIVYYILQHMLPIVINGLK